MSFIFRGFFHLSNLIFWMLVAFNIFKEGVLSCMWNTYMYTWMNVQLSLLVFMVFLQSWLILFCSIITRMNSIYIYMLLKLNAEVNFINSQIPYNFVCTSLQVYACVLYHIHCAGGHFNYRCTCTHARPWVWKSSPKQVFSFNSQKTPKQGFCSFFFCQNTPLITGF